MSARTAYTHHDQTGALVSKGDRVTVSFTGQVLSIDRFGHMALRLPDGTIASYDPAYQQLRKVSGS